MFRKSNKTVIDGVKVFSYTNITKRNKFTCNKIFNRFATDQDTNRVTANTAMDSFTNTNITSVKGLVKK